MLWVFSFFFSPLLPFALTLTISLSFPPSFLLCHLAAVFTVQCAGKQVFDMKPVCVCARFFPQIASFPAFICVCVYMFFVRFNSVLCLLVFSMTLIGCSFMALLDAVMSSSLLRLYMFLPVSAAK